MEEGLLRMAQAFTAGEIYPGVSVDPQVAHGKPVFTGTRILVSPVLGALAAGDSMELVCDAYGLTQEQLQAGIGYAASLVAHEQVFVIADA
jgi:uncharacterized protein (DUF433 family)